MNDARTVLAAILAALDLGIDPAVILAPDSELVQAARKAVAEPQRQ